jgi:pimeloyl-ACP methyl ester carboxylesterase
VIVGASVRSDGCDLYYPSPADLATVEVPVMCSYGSRSPDSMGRLVRLLASAIPTARAHRIEGAGHAAPFDATAAFVHLIADTIRQQTGPRARRGPIIPA